MLVCNRILVYFSYIFDLLFLEDPPKNHLKVTGGLLKKLFIIVCTGRNVWLASDISGAYWHHIKINETLRLFSCLKDKVRTPGRTMFFQSEIKRWQCVCWLSILWGFKSIRCKRNLFDNNRLKNQLCPRIAPNHLRPTGKQLETLCLVPLSCDHFVFSYGLL